jgi:hypothetical protein
VDDGTFDLNRAMPEACGAHSLEEQLEVLLSLVDRLEESF